MTNTYSISRCTWKIMRKVFFHFLDLSILNSCILLPSYGSKLSHRNFTLALVRALTEEGGRVPNLKPPHFTSQPN
jgi:hypothetical protein